MGRPTRRYSMRALVLIAFSGALLFFFSIAVYFLYRNMSSMLTQAENRNVLEQSKTVAGALDAALQRACAITRDYARREETIAFLTGARQGESLQDSSWELQKQHFDLIVVKDASGADLLAGFFEESGRRSDSLPEGFSAKLNSYASGILFPDGAGARNREERGAAGVFIHQGVPYYVCVMPVFKTEEPPLFLGTITFGYVLHNERIQSLIHSEDLLFSPQPAAGVADPSFGAVSMTDNMIFIALPLPGLTAANDLVLLVGHGREMHKAGFAVIMKTVFALFVIMVLFAATLFCIMRRALLLPIAHLSADVSAVAKRYASGDAPRRVNAEFYALCTAINELLENLERSRLAEEQSKVSISVMQSILNGMDAYLYVSDPETDEILFVNDKMRGHFGIQGAGVGEICWQVLQDGMESRCSFCPNYKLAADPEAVVVWEEHNTLTRHYYRNTDRLIPWLGNRRVHLQHSVDITDIKVTESALQKRLAQQNLMAAITEGVIAGDSLDAFISRSLQLTGEFMGVDRIRLGRYDAQALFVYHQWQNKALAVDENADPSPAFDTSSPLHISLIQNRAAYVAVDDMREAPEYRGVVQDDIKSLLVLPLYIAGNLWGVLSLSHLRTRHAWAESDIHLASLIANVFSVAVSRHQIEERLVKLSSVVSSSPQYMAYMNTALEYEYVNDSVLELTGYPYEEIMAGGFTAILDAEDSQVFKDIYFPAILELGSLYLTLPIRRKDGETRHLAFSFFLLDESKQRVGAIAADMTEKTLLEKAMIEAREQAEKSSRAKGEFLSRMSHEMRTPMNAIIGMTNIAKGSSSLERKEYCLDKIAEASQHLLGVINDILDMSKIEANKLELSFAEFRFEKMLTRVVNVINFKVEEKQQTLIIDVAPDVPRVLVGDEQRLSQIITNLLSNATKFTPDQGTLALTVRKNSEENNLCVLHIAVRDSGIGVAPEQQARLFYSFEQADGGISRRFGGTGLGLAICKRLVEMMGGEIWVESELGAGATFQFTFRAERGQDAAPVDLAPDIRREALRVLVVDDVAEVREYMLRAMETLRIPCEAAAGGGEALEMIRKAKDKPYTLVFVDWMMPGMDGIELTRRIRGIAEVGPVIIMASVTAWSDIEKEAGAAGITRFLQKPIFFAQLADSINDALGRAEAGSGPGATASSPELPHFPGKTLLLAEDNELNREIAVALLEESEITIHCAEDGREAVEMFRQNPDLYDLIFMDIHMPEVDGYEASRRIRGLPFPGSRTVPIVAMTANVFREDIEKCFAAGMNGHLGKPLDTAELYAVLRRFLQDSPG